MAGKKKPDIMGGGRKTVFLKNPKTLCFQGAA